jgi:hypothetical protein
VARRLAAANSDFGRETAREHEHASVLSAEKDPPEGRWASLGVTPVHSWSGRVAVSPLVADVLDVTKDRSGSRKRSRGVVIGVNHFGAVVEKRAGDEQIYGYRVQHR